MVLLTDYLIVAEIAKRKSDLLTELSTNPKALRGALRVQAVFRGRLTRIRVRREAQMYHLSLLFVLGLMSLIIFEMA